MEELYRLIEEKIAASGCPRQISGEAFYNDICDETDGREPGSYLFIIKKEDGLIYEGSVDIMEENMDLHYVDITDGDCRWHVDFDA